MRIEVRRLEKKFRHAWYYPYIKLVLKHLGLDWPKKQKDWDAHWEEMLRNILQIGVRVIPRVVGVDTR